MVMVVRLVAEFADVLHHVADFPSVVGSLDGSDVRLGLSLLELLDLGAVEVGELLELLGRHLLERPLEEDGHLPRFVHDFGWGHVFHDGDDGCSYCGLVGCRLTLTL